MTTATTRTYRLGVLHGDGIGPEIVPSSVAIVDAASPPPASTRSSGTSCLSALRRIEEHGAHTPESTLKALEDLDGWLLGPHDSAAYPEPFKSQLNPSGTIRKHFGLYANIRPAKAFEGGNADRPRHRPGHRPGEHRRLLRRPQHLPGHRRDDADP